MTYEATETRRRQLEAAHAPRIGRVLLATGTRAARAVASGTWPLAMHLADDGLAEALTDLYTDTIPAFGRAIEAELRPSGKALPPGDPWYEDVQRFIESAGAAMVREISATTMQALREVIAQALADGLSAQATARALRDVWPELTAARALTIARTEVVRASNYGSHQGAKRTARDYGLELDKVWLATPDSRTRDTHRAADGQRVPLDGDFTVGGYLCDYPGDPQLPASESVRCRCTLTYEVREPLKALSDRDRYIVASYPALRDRHGREIALTRIKEHIADAAEAKGWTPIGERQIRRIVYANGAADGTDVVPSAAA